MLFFTRSVFPITEISKTKITTPEFPNVYIVIRRTAKRFQCITDYTFKAFSNVLLHQITAAKPKEQQTKQLNNNKQTNKN